MFNCGCKYEVSPCGELRPPQKNRFCIDSIQVGQIYTWILGIGLLLQCHSLTRSEKVQYLCHNRTGSQGLIIFLSKNLQSFFPFIIGLKNPFSPVYNTDTVHSIIVCFFCTYWLYKYIVVYVIKSGVYKTELGKKVPQNNQRNRSCCKATHKTNYYIQVPNYKFMFCTCPICCILLCSLLWFLQFLSLHVFIKPKREEVVEEKGGPSG